MTDTVRTDFAPAQRSDAAELSSQARTVAATAFFRELLNAVPDILMVLNPNRQVVFANAALCDAFGAEALDKAIGQRTGELWGCMHAHDNPGGCGTGHSCSKCGAVLAILSAQGGRDSVRECRIALANGGALDLKVAATQVPVGGLAYTVFSATDISGDKRRQVLEQLMFRNLSHGLEAVHDRLVMEGKHDLTAATGQLLGVITMHRLLAAAEAGRLRPRSGAVSTAELLREFAQQARTEISGEEIEVRVAAPTTDMVLNIDRTLVRQVMAALVSNAVEASLPGETVTIGVDAAEARCQFHVHNTRDIEVDAQLQLFQRGFSTKGEGRGLGLYGARLLTERYLGGTIEFFSDVDTGTSFRVELPLEPARSP